MATRLPASNRTREELTQLLVAELRLEPTEIGVGAQHEDAVELLLLLDLVRIDRKVPLADRLEGRRVRARATSGHILKVIEIQDAESAEVMLTQNLTAFANRSAKDLTYTVTLKKVVTVRTN